MDIIAEATNILRKPVGWIELDIDFDINTWEYESGLITDSLVEHREGDGHNGWRSCCLHGISVDKTGHWSRYTNDESQINYHWTELTELVPNITNFWKSFPVEGYARLRFMELAPGGWVAPHNDAPDGLRNTDFDMMDHMIPINIAITHPQGCDMFLDTYGTVPWTPGKAFIVNITDTHSVKNNSSSPRMHMIAHCIIGKRKKEFAELVVRSYNKQYGKI